MKKHRNKHEAVAAQSMKLFKWRYVDRITEDVTLYAGNHNGVVVYMHVHKTTAGFGCTFGIDHRYRRRKIEEFDDISKFTNHVEQYADQEI